MLNGHPIRPLGQGAAVAVLAAAALAVTAAPARADYVYCPPAGGDCYVVVTTGGRAGGGGGGSGGGGSGAGPRVCTWAGHTVPCTIELDGTGWFNALDGCYYVQVSDEVAPGSPLWEGHRPGDGDVYALACYPPDRVDTGPGFGGITFRWLPTPPPGFGAATTPAQLAAEAVNRLGIRGPTIGAAPAPGGAGAPGLPVWLWSAVTPATWGPITATAAVPGLSVTAAARATQIRWQLGDGHEVTCTNAGTPYRPEYGLRASPTCGYPPGYSRPGDYTITATTTWAVTWTGGGATGVLAAQRTSTATVHIDNLHLLVR